MLLEEVEEVAGGLARTALCACGGIEMCVSSVLFVYLRMLVGKVSLLSIRYGGLGLGGFKEVR